MRNDDGSDDERAGRARGARWRGGFLSRLVSGIVRELAAMAIIFAVATGISAAVCLYYGLLPLLSLIGGFLAVGAVFYVRSASLFD